MNYQKTSIEGLELIYANVIRDERGTFTKTFEAIEFMKIGLKVDFSEDYFSFSRSGVLRGMHFQLPPLDHEKVVCCSFGRVLDVVLDLRVNSNSYLKTYSIEISSAGGEVLYIETTKNERPWHDSHRSTW